MVDFEQRRHRGLGRYVTHAELERVPGRQLEEALRVTVAGAHFVKTPYGQTWLVSARHAATNQALYDNRDPDKFKNAICHAQVILDGAVISSSTAPRAPRVLVGSEGTGGFRRSSLTEGGDDPVDLNQFMGDQLEGVEY
jgi:hypothetical protein